MARSTLAPLTVSGTSASLRRQRGLHPLALPRQVHVQVALQRRPRQVLQRVQERRHGRERERLLLQGFGRGQCAGAGLCWFPGLLVLSWLAWWPELRRRWRRLGLAEPLRQRV